MKYILETDRLKLREFNFNDALFIIELLNSPGWLQFIGNRNVTNEVQAKSYLENGPIKSYGENGFGLWLVEKKEDSIPIGMCGIIYRASLDNPDIGYAFLPEFTGHGYAFEIVNATLKLAKDTFKIPVIFAITTESNLKSKRLLDKLGFKYNRRIFFQDDNEELLLYSS